MKITVVIPTFNSMKHIDQCLSSVLEQTYENMEVIVYDNESTDGTYEHLLQLNDDRFEVRSIPNVYPNGYREAMDHVFDNCEGEYVTFVCSDDYIDKSYISNYATIIQNSNVDIKCIQSGLTWVDEKGSTLQKKIHNYNTLDEFKSKCLDESPVNNPTVFYHRSLGSILGDCREAHIRNALTDIGVGDYDMWCGLADRGVFIYSVPGFLGYFYRWHKDQCTWKVKKSPTNYDWIIQNYWKEKWSSNE